MRRIFGRDSLPEDFAARLFALQPAAQFHPLDLRDEDACRAAVSRAARPSSTSAPRPR